ncbi:hypothetical protein Pcinc_037758 [Petrolisthes cinctipes]|uniref:Uncharacterized protein n=1 Tax=Petrolisthes cinctipes TaxID=88211 RepID=A0AAE1BS86_PETCI|nr:hypothetical protein Pcinc_037758 [Petrolisthes cinctipes]
MPGWDGGSYSVPGQSPSPVEAVRPSPLPPTPRPRPHQAYWGFQSVCLPPSSSLYIRQLTYVTNLRDQRINTNSLDIHPSIHPSRCLLFAAAAAASTYRGATTQVPLFDLDRFIQSRTRSQASQNREEGKGRTGRRAKTGQGGRAKQDREAGQSRTGRQGKAGQGGKPKQDRDQEVLSYQCPRYSERCLPPGNTLHLTHIP